MANHKSAVKKYKRDEKKRLINKMNKTKMRNWIKKFKKEIEAGKVEDAKAMFPKVMSTIDKLNTKGTIHKKTASRYKSRLTALLNKASS